MGELETFLQTDRDNLEEGLRFVAAFDAQSLPTVDLIAEVLQRAADALGAHTDLPQKEHDVAQWAKSQGLSFRDAYGLLGSATLVGQPKGPDVVGQAKTDLHAATGFVARCYLTLRLRRDFLFGMSDVLKNRVISGLGYLRLQCESLAFIRLITADNEMGSKWLGAHSGEEGQAFFKRFNSQVVEEIRRLDFYFYYDFTSANALHSRIGGVAYGVLAGGAQKQPGDRSISFVYQDMHNPVVYYLWFATYLRFHERLLSALARSQPELKANSSFLDACSTATAAVDGLWNSLRPRYIELRKAGVPDALLRD